MLEYYDSALKHFEEGKYYRDAYVVSLNIIQTYLARQSYSDAVPIWTGWDSWGRQ